MVHADAVIVFCDDVKRLLELGNVPKAIIGMTALMEQAEKEKTRNSKVYQITPFNIAQSKSITTEDVLLKINEIINDVNRRKI